MCVIYKTSAAATLAVAIIAAVAPASSLRAQVPPLSEHSAAPSAVVLRLGDIPIGFSQSVSRALKSGEITSGDRVSWPSMLQHGYAGSYETLFQRPAPTGVNTVVDNVVKFRSKSSAVWLMTRSEAAASMTFRSHRLRAMSVGSIGDRAVGASYIIQANDAQYTGVYVYFRRGNWDIYVGEAGLTGTYDPATVIAFARIVDHRIGTQVR